MKQLSHWARINQWKARIIITIAWILLTILAIFIGVTLTKMDIGLTDHFLVPICISFFCAVLFYPFRWQKKQTGPRSFYRRQKGCDLLLAISSFGMILYAGNRPGELFRHYGNLHATEILPSSQPADSQAISYKSIKDFSASMKDKDGKMLKWKERKKLLKQQVRAIKKAPGTSQVEKAMLVFLACLAAIGLLYLVAALACSLSCNGSEVAAFFVGIGGTALVIFLLILLIRGIYGKKKKTIPKIETGP